MQVIIFKFENGRGPRLPFFCGHHNHLLEMCARPETKSAVLSRSAMKSWFLILMNVLLCWRPHCSLDAYPKQGSNFLQWIEEARVILSLCAVHLNQQWMFIQLPECHNNGDIVAQNFIVHSMELCETRNTAHFIKTRNAACWSSDTL